MFSAALAVAAACRKQPFACDLVFLGRDADFRAGKSVRRYANAALLPRKSGLLGNAYLGGEVISSWGLVCFSLTYSQGKLPRISSFDRDGFVLGAFLVPLLSLAAIYRPFFDIVAYKPPVEGWGLMLDEPAKILNVLVLVSTVLILMNLERTFRSAVGTMRWRIKFLVLGLGIVFGARIYTGSQGLLFSDYSPGRLTRRNSRAADRVRIDGRSFSPEWFRRNRCLSVHAVLAHFADGFVGRGISFYCWRAWPDRGADLAIPGSFPIQAFVVLLGFALLAVLLRLGSSSAKYAGVSLAAILKGRSMIFARYGRDLLDVSSVPRSARLVRCSRKIDL